MANRITTLFDLDTKGFDSGLKKLRGEVAKADGLVGKLKTAGSGLGTILQDNIASASLSAGTALVAFGLKSVKAFQDTALAAGAFADATGTSVEAASRLIEVSGDIGIEAGTVETALGKMNKTLGASPNLFNMLGVQIAKTATGATDVNGTFLNVVDRLNAIKDPAEKARVATQLLGRDWQGIAELIAQGSGKLKQSMADVQDGKVISPEELKKARDLRAGMDNLNDSLENITLTVGGALAPAMTELSNSLASVSDAAQKVPIDKVLQEGYNESGLKKIADGITAVGQLWDWAFGDDKKQRIRATAEELEHAKEITEAQASMTVNLAYSAEQAAQTEKEHADALKATSDQMAEQNRAAKDLLDTERSLYGDARDQIQKQADYADALGTASEKLKEYTKATGDHRAATDAQRQSTKDAADAMIAASEAFVASKGASLDSKLGIDMQIQSLQSFENTLKPGSPLFTALASYIGQLQAIPAKVDTMLNLRVTGATVTAGGDFIGIPKGKKASGGPVDAGQPYLVGERGPEIVVPGQSGTVIPNNRIEVIPNNRIDGGGSVNVTINMPPGTDGSDVVKAIQQYEKRNGSSWRM